MSVHVGAGGRKDGAFGRPQGAEEERAGGDACRELYLASAEFCQVCELFLTKRVSFHALRQATLQFAAFLQSFTPERHR